MNTLQSENNNKVIFLFGPTAVGKTDLLCSFFVPGFEVVNADSVQVFKGLDVGSAKADSSLLSKIPHHLIDILEPWEKFNVADFIRLADDACSEIRSRGNIPVISGGTAFYFKNYLYGLSEAPQSDAGVRKEVASYMAEAGNVKAHEYLESIDPVSASRINVNDTYRISRAIEVFRQCNKPLSSFAVPSTPRNNINALIIGLTRDKEDLRARIAKRVDVMFDNGIVDEIKKLVSMGADLSWQSMQGIGYSEFMKALESCSFENLDFEQIKEQIVMDSIHYAKRQMTFFRSFENVHWVNPSDTSSLKKLVSTFVNS